MSDRARLMAVVRDGRAVSEAAQGDEVELFLDRTPFYGEKGGQVGDTGLIASPSGEAQVLDTVHPTRGLTAHRARVVRGRLVAGEEVEASVDRERRMAIRRNHTATHLLHNALRHVLGDHAKQAGSLVEPHRLRFDFTHYAPLTREELARVEEMANRAVMEDYPVRAYVTTYEYALSINAVALFGEKYEDYVRVVEVDELSRELCGGTHVARTGEIGMLVVVSEAGIGANMRRIEALTGSEAYRYVRRRRDMLEEMASSLKVDVEKLPERLSRLQQRVKELESELRRREKEEMSSLVDGGISWRESEVAGGLLLTAEVRDLDPQALRELAERTLARRKAKAVSIAAVQGGKANIVVHLSRELVEKGLSAVELARRAAALLGGGGGGRPDMAVGGGSQAGRVAEALQEVTEEIRRGLGDGHA